MERAPVDQLGQRISRREGDLLGFHGRTLAVPAQILDFVLRVYALPHVLVDGGLQTQNVVVPENERIRKHVPSLEEDLVISHSDAIDRLLRSLPEIQSVKALRFEKIIVAHKGSIRTRFGVS